ncbi:MAG: hypothetical protein GY772_22945 [bacterium]|nr:hypothetical protein [bacterium]
MPPRKKGFGTGAAGPKKKTKGPKPLGFEPPDLAPRPPPRKQKKRREEDEDEEEEEETPQEAPPARRAGKKALAAPKRKTSSRKEGGPRGPEEDETRLRARTRQKLKRALDAAPPEQEARLRAQRANTETTGRVHFSSHLQELWAHFGSGPDALEQALEHDARERSERLEVKRSTASKGQPATWEMVLDFCKGNEEVAGHYCRWVQRTHPEWVVEKDPRYGCKTWVWLRTGFESTTQAVTEVSQPSEGLRAPEARPAQKAIEAAPAQQTLENDTGSAGSATAQDTPRAFEEGASAGSATAAKEATGETEAAGPPTEAAGSQRGHGEGEDSDEVNDPAWMEAQDLVMAAGWSAAPVPCQLLLCRLWSRFPEVRNHIRATVNAEIADAS